MQTAANDERPLTPLEYAAQTIKENILSGRYSPGQRLVEADLMAELGLKRGYVREALRILSGEGIIELVPKKGARVRKLYVGDIREMMPVLGALLEATVVEAISKDAIKRAEQTLNSLVEQMRFWAAQENSEQFHLATLRYHQVIDKAANNSFLVYVNSKIHSDIFQKQFIELLHIENWDSYLDHFIALHSALLNGDTEKAKTLIFQHQSQLLAVLSNPGDSVIWR